MTLHSIPDAELRDNCRRIIENLELWLRRLIHDQLAGVYGSNYLSAKRADGSYVIKSDVRRSISNAYNESVGRFPRQIDAAMLNNEIDIICNPSLYNAHFKEALKAAYPNGHIEARTFLERLVEPRNRLYHANPISIRMAEQIVCYSNDAIDSLTHYYRDKGLEQKFNVPMINRISDSFGGSFFSNQILRNTTGAGIVDRRNDSSLVLRAGDTLSVEVEIDPAFDPESYDISWVIPFGGQINTRLPRRTITLHKRDISPEFVIYCSVASKKDWHRLRNVDDRVGMIYEVLPPIDG